MSSFSQLLKESSPAHYSKFYIHYDGCKRLIDYLLEIQKSWKSGHGMPVGISTVLQKKIVGTLQSVLSLSLPNVAHNLVLQLAFQSIFRESIMGEVSGVNQFVVLRYQSIQEGIRALCGRLHEIIRLEAAYMKLKSSLQNQDSLTRMPSSDQKIVNDESECFKVSEPLRLLSESGTLTEFKSVEQYEDWRLQELKECENLLRMQSAETLHLDQFIRLNYKAVLRLASLFDKVVSVSVSPWIVASLSKETFANVNLDRLLIFVSAGWSKFRIAESRETFVNATWVPPETFIRRTTKYWIPIDQIVRVKLSILEHMPYLIYGTSTDTLEAYVDPYNRSADCCSSNQRIDEGQLITSVYFDSTNGYSYYRRLHRFHGAQLIRFRWYGNNNCELEKPIFVECKTHRERWTGELSTKERFTIPQKFTSDFMSGKKTIHEIAQTIASEEFASLEQKKFKNMLRLGEEVQNLISKKKMTPVIRTSYRRSAFQLATSNKVRFSIDTNLSMVDEFVSSSQSSKKEHWCRLGEEILGKNEVIHFPYAILEVKLQTDEEPTWVTDILYAANAIMVYKFSKFLHGMASLHHEMIAGLELPHWLNRSDEIQKDNKLTLVTQKKFDAAPDSFAFFANTSPSPRFYEMWMLPINWAMRARMVAQKAILSLFEFWPEQNYFGLNVENNNHVTSHTVEAEMNKISHSRRIRNNVVCSATEKDPNFLMRLTLEWSQSAKAENAAEAIYERSLNILKLDPKSFFASERIFLHYSQKALYLGFLGIFLITWNISGVSKIVGIMLTGVCIFVIVLSYGIFLSRSKRIGRRLTKSILSQRERLDSFYAPIFILTVISLTVIVSSGISLVKHLDFIQ